MSKYVPYSQQLKDPRWQRKRLEILNRANFTCEECGATDKTLHVHHKLYRKGAMAWEYSGDELKALCEDCHESEHLTRAALNEVIAHQDLAGLEILLGFAKSLIVEDAWMADDITELPPIEVRTAEEAIGLGWGLGLYGSEPDHLLLEQKQIPVATLLHIQRCCQQRSRKYPRACSLSELEVMADGAHQNN